MSTITPTEVVYKWEATVFGVTGTYNLDVTNITPSMDMDRSPYCQVTLELEGVTEEIHAALDPLTSPTIGNGQLRLTVWCEDAAGNALSWVGRDFFDSSPAPVRVWIQRVEWDRVSGRATVVCANDESRLMDKRRIAVGTIDTGATTVYELVYWALIDVFGGFVLGADPAASATPIPAGDRRLMQPGETFMELLVPELQAIDYRLYDHWGRGWSLYQREHTPKWVNAPLEVQLATHEHREGAPDFSDPIVFGVTERTTRQGDFADGVLVRYDMTQYGGTVTTQRSGNGVNTKGRVVTYQRPAPSANAADSIVQRTRIRGRDIEVTARARFDVLPGMTARIYTRTGVPRGSIRAVEWDGAAGTMTLRIQSGLPE